MQQEAQSSSVKKRKSAEKHMEDKDSKSMLRVYQSKPILMAPLAASFPFLLSLFFSLPSQTNIKPAKLSQL